MERGTERGEVLKRQHLNVSDAWEQGKTLPFALIRTWSAVTLGETPKELPEGMIEARFFSAEEEIRIFDREGVQTAALLRTEDGDVSYQKTFVMANPVFGKLLTVQYELEADEDGQYAVVATRLVDWKGEV